MKPDEIERVRRLCYRADSFSRVEVLLESCPVVHRGGFRVVGNEWFSLLGEFWDMCDNIGQYREFFRLILRKATKAQLQAMMTDEEREKWELLPDPIRAWRGCEANDGTGLSFSLSEDIARRFPFLNRYLAKSPTLLTASIRKEFAVLKIGRDEEEIISARAIIENIEAL
jgi:hypothetical protein